MGIETELFKKDKKERYNLDKGSWGEIFGYGTMHLTNEEVRDEE